MDMDDVDRIDPSEWLYRRGLKYYLNPDGTPTSRVFTPRVHRDNNRLSVNRANLTTPQATMNDPTIPNPDSFCLFEIQQTSVLEVGLDTHPAPSMDNPAHAVICCIEPQDRTLPGALAKRARLVHI